MDDYLFMEKKKNCDKLIHASRIMDLTLIGLENWIH